MKRLKSTFPRLGILNGTGLPIRPSSEQSADTDRIFGLDPEEEVTRSPRRLWKTIIGYLNVLPKLAGGTNRVLLPLAGNGQRSEDDGFAPGDWSHRLTPVGRVGSCC